MPLPDVEWKYKGYKADTAFAVLDLGLDAPNSNKQFRVLTGIDTDQDGIIEAEDRAKARTLLNEEAVFAGASTIDFKTGCVHLDTVEAYIATNDRVIYFNEGDVVEVARRPESLSAGLLLFLIQSDLLKGTNNV